MSLAALLLTHPADAEHVELLSTYAPGGLYYNVQLVDDIVYMAGFDYFHVVDVSDPTQPSQLASIHSASASVALEVVGDRVYLASYFSPELVVMGVSNPAAPVTLGGFTLPFGYGLDLEVVGDLVYLAADPGGLRILDVSALPTIALLGTFELPDTIRSVAVSGSHAYLAAGDAGLLIIDISEPTMPDHVGTIAGSGVTSLDVAGTHLYVGGDEFRIFDVSSSGSPVLVGQAPIRFYSGAGTHMHVNQAEGFAYAGEYMIDVLNVKKPVLVATLSIPYLYGGVRGSDGRNGIVYVPQSILGLHVFRVSLPPRPLPALGGLAALPLAIAGWRALRKRRSLGR